MAAREVSAIKPILDKNQVKLIGVGLEQLGVEEFIEGKFFQGGTLIALLCFANHKKLYILADLFIDEKKQSYNELGFKRFGFFGLFPAVLSRLSRAAQARAKSLGLGGNMAGDGYQNGGALVVKQGGETLFHFVQEEAAEHASNADILKALGLSVDGPTPTAETPAA